MCSIKNARDDDVIYWLSTSENGPMNTSGTIDSIFEVPHIYLSCNSTCNIISDRMYGKLLLLSSDPDKYSLNALSTTYRISCAHNGIDLNHWVLFAKFLLYWQV